MTRILADAIRIYFSGERQENSVIIAFGVVLLVTGVGLAWRGDNFARGLAAMLALIALLGASAAIPILVRDSKHLERLLQMPPVAAASSEAVRIDKVIANYPLYRWVYAIATAIALLLMLLARNPLWQGAATGLLILAAYGVVIDHYSEARAVRYSAALRST